MISAGTLEVVRASAPLQKRRYRTRAGSLQMESLALNSTWRLKRESCSAF
jgi:hypothetical protein